MITTYLFDLDDTIIDSSIYIKMYQPIIEKLSNKVSPLKVQVAINEIKKKTGKPRADTYDLCENFNCLDIYYTLLRRFIEEYAKLKFDIKSVFQKIRQNGKKIGIVSNSKEETIKLFITHFGLNQYIDFIYPGDKTDPDYWQTLIVKKKLETQNTLLIDNDDDVIDLAKASGLKALKIKKSMIEGFNF